MQIKWSLFLLNHLLEDGVDAQAGEHIFSYSWLLILIALVAWMELEDYQPVSVFMENLCKVTLY